MVLLGAILALLAVALLGALLIVGYITPLALFGPGFSHHLRTRHFAALCAGWRHRDDAPRCGNGGGHRRLHAEHRRSRLRAALRLIADGTIWPIVFVTMLSATLGVLVAIPPALMRRLRPA